MIGLMEQGRAIPNDDQRTRIACALDLQPELLLEEAQIVATVPPAIAEPLDDPERADAPANVRG